MGDASCGGGQEKEWMRVSWTTSELSVFAPTSKRLQPRTRGDGARRCNKGRNVSWRNKLLQRKPGMDYDTQLYNNMSERDGKDRREDNPKKPCLFWFARES